MARKRARKSHEATKTVEVEEKNGPSLVPTSLLESELARTQLRERWELASVLHFLRVFKPVIESKLEISAEEIESGLITPNGDLSQLHISLLKGIPPVSKNLTGPDAWVAALYKKLASWWPWVAEGDIPLKEAQGEEISTYKELDPINRLLILKALCEVRAFQDDAVSYLNDALKQGAEVCTFRKARLGGDSTGIAYWNDGDEVMGYRLYREVTKVEFTPRKGKGRLTQPPKNYQWETIATNLEEFQQISDKLSSSEIVGEAAVAKILNDEILPVLEGIQKKKEQALKRHQKQVMLLNGYLNSYTLGGTRSCRNRKPVKYTFDEYDRSIEEAIQMDKRRKTDSEPKHRQKGVGHEAGNDVNSNGNSLNNGVMEHDTDDDDKFRGVDGDGDSDSGDEDYDDKNDENDNGDNGNDEDTDNDNGDNETDEDTEKENNIIGPETRATRHFQKKNGHSTRDAELRRSTRVTGNAGRPKLESENQMEMRKQSSHTDDDDSGSNSDSDGTNSDSDDGSSSKSSVENTSGSRNESMDVLEGLLEESDGVE